jgi:hypothetical protein
MHLHPTHLKNELDIQVVLNDVFRLYLPGEWTWHSGNVESCVYTPPSASPVHCTSDHCKTTQTESNFFIFYKCCAIRPSVFGWILQNLITDLSVAWIGTNGKSFKPGIEEVRCWKSENIKPYLKLANTVYRNGRFPFQMNISYNYSVWHDN